MLLTAAQQGAAYLAHAAPWFWPLVGALLGGVVASFAGCMAYRIPRGMGLTQPPSQCNGCGRRLTAQELIPVVSFLAQRGRCSCGKVKLPFSMLFTEVACAVLGALLLFWAES